MRFIPFVFCAGLVLSAQVRSVTDPGVVTTRQAITPAGVPAVFDGRVYGVAFGKDFGDLWVANASQLYRLDWKANRVLDKIALGATPGLQGLSFDAVAGVPLLSTEKHGHVQFLALNGDQLTPLGDDLGTYVAGAIAVAPQPDAKGRRLAVVPLIANNQLAVIDLKSTWLVGKAPTGIAPFGAAIAHDGSIAFVTNWGGRAAKAGELSGAVGPAAAADHVVIDQRGIASTGTVTRIDLATATVTHTIEVGLHPTAILWDETGRRLYVANGNSDSISVIDSETLKVAQTFAIQPFAVKAAGIAPTALALATDRKTLYVACGGINAVVVLDAANGTMRGMIPTAWYPNSLSLSADGKWLAISALLGAGSGWREQPSKRYVHADRGSVAVLPIPDAAQLASYTTAVTINNRMQPATSEGKAVKAFPQAIEHVVWIIKENRTYDQVFGDIAKGNGDPSLVMFGKDVTPNQHKLADEFVLLDNFYATGGNSADGHQWITQANETDYCLWPGYAGRSYPFDGTDPIAYSKSGFLWDYALARGKTVRIYGEYAGHLTVPGAKRQEYFDRWSKGEDFRNEWNMTAPIPTVDKLLVRSYPTYTTGIPDVVRARIFLADLHRMEQQGAMPNLMLVQLPSNHTNGTNPGSSTPKAMVADNDFAVGQIVDGLTHSKFWPKMVIFVVEDDAQNGVDHVDGHRTVALAVSPYTRRGHVDSTFYSTQSMVKTIEVILGLPTMSLFDLIADDMRYSFQQQADLTAYSAVDPVISLRDVNPPARALNGSARQAAVASSKMRFDIPDDAPTERLNRILWHEIRGWNTPYPGAHHAVFAPLSVDTDDDDRDRR
ncbi:MAG TPA: alkaline phosphatase family protein [Bryobacteraceae bacterium]|nr:alkaline phosphatase family protein [Bryobacteraceae bacterium]